MNRIEDAQSWINDCIQRPNCAQFVVELHAGSEGEDMDGSGDREERTERPQPTVIGLVGCTQLPEVACALLPEFWNKGYATEAAKALMPLYFKHVPGARSSGFDHASADIGLEHGASRRVLEKSGFILREERGRFFHEVTPSRTMAVYRMARPGTKLL